MAKARLKVYRALMGFAETVVAAPNQKAALDAWGARQNLFAEGLAGTTEDPAAVASALEHPGEVLQRAVGSTDAYRPGPAAPPSVPAPKRPRGSAAAKAPASKPSRPKPDRSALDRAEAALRALEAEASAAEADFARQRAALETQAAEAARRFDQRRRTAAHELDVARAAYEKAGGGAAGR